MKMLFGYKHYIEFEKLYHKQLKSFIIDTDPFDFDNIDTREFQIKEYQKIFKENPNKVSSIWLAVNFDRTDNMRRSIMSIYKNIIQLRIQISIIVTDMQLSENLEQDKKTLIDNFQQFNPKQIVFLQQKTKLQETIKQLNDTLPKQNIEQFYPISLKGTMFEEIDQEQQQQIKKNMIDVIQKQVKK